MISKEATLVAIDDSIAHWHRMIHFVEQQNPIKTVSASVMRAVIHECWYGDYCSLCELFDADCDICPLTFVGECCDCGDTSSWMKVDSAEIWSEWVIAAKEGMLPALARARKHVEEN